MKVVPCLILLLFSAVLHAGMSLPLSLDDLVQQSDRIFVGRCLDSERDLDPRGLPSLWSHFEVVRAVRGVARGKTVWVKQFGISGEGGCQEGEELLLFLYPESDLEFTSPVGLGQGRMPVVFEGGEKKVVTPYPHLRQEIPETLESFLEILKEKVAHDQ